MKTQMKYVGFAFVAFALLVLSSCKKDETPAPTGLSASTIQGNWAITTSEGTEWKKGEGIITPRAAAPDMIGLKLEITATTITIKDISGTAMGPPITYTLDVTAKTILIGADGNTGLGLFNISNFVTSTSMAWDQRDPIDADYTFKADCTCELYFQKFWTLAKMP